MRVARDSLFQSDYIAYVGGEQSPAPGGVTVTSTAAGTAQVCRSSVQLQMHAEEHCSVVDTGTLLQGVSFL